LNGTDLSDAGLKRLAPLKQLEILSLSGKTGITDAGLDGLAHQVSELPHLERLGIGDQGLASLARLPNVEIFEVVRCRGSPRRA